jgi:hypothetical protein
LWNCRDRKSLNRQPTEDRNQWWTRGLNEPQRMTERVLVKQSPPTWAFDLVNRKMLFAILRHNGLLKDLVHINDSVLVTYFWYTPKRHTEPILIYNSDRLRHDSKWKQSCFFFYKKKRTTRTKGVSSKWLRLRGRHALGRNGQSK